MAKSKEIAIVEFNAPIISEDISSLMAEEMDGLTIQFDRVKIPSGGGIAFEVPGDDPESPDMTKELIGVIVDKHPINAYYTKKYDGQKNPPDCSSLDGIIGVGDPGGSCKNCPYNQYGTGRDQYGNLTKGKACQNKHRVYLLQSGSLFPLLLTLPSTSLKSFSDYMGKRVVAKGLRSYGVVTKITLKKVKNTDGIEYSEAQFGVCAVLDNEATVKMADYSQNIKLNTRQLEITHDTDFVTLADDEEMPI